MTHCALYNAKYGFTPGSTLPVQVQFSSSNPSGDYPNQASPQPKRDIANVCPTPDCREAPRKKTNKIKALSEVAGLMSVALLLHQLPPRLPKDDFKTVLPADWKVWARVILGIAAVQKINQAFDWKPKPWLGALEAVAVINPLAVGFSRNNFRQMMVMAPLVAGLVQGTSYLQQKISGPAQDKANIPPVLTRLGLSLGLGIASFLGYSAIYRRIASTGIIGKELKDKAIEGGSAFASATFATCARGCTPGSFICLGEMADIVGSLGSLEEPDVATEVDDAKSKASASRPLPQVEPSPKHSAQQSNSSAKLLTHPSQSNQLVRNDSNRAKQ
jgi:hypothetical protein